MNTFLPARLALYFNVWLEKLAWPKGPVGYGVLLE